MSMRNHTGARKRSPLLRGRVTDSKKIRPNACPASMGKLGLLLPSITEKQEDIEANHGEIQHIEPQNDIIAVKDLMGDAEYIPHPDDQEEKHTFPAGTAGSERFVDIERPGKAETDKHPYFE